MKANASVVVAALVALLVAGASGCELFGSIACQNDVDCPDSVPICEAGYCGTTGEPDGTRKGLDDESCSEDADCGGGFLCYDGADDIAAEGDCLPPEGTDDCKELIQGQPRAPAGPVIFDAEVTAGVECDDVTFKVFDREGDFVVPITSGASVEVSAGGSCCQSRTDFTLEGGVATLRGVCSSGSSALFVRDQSGNVSNTLCVEFAGGLP